jgi:hypothetical protein
MMDKSSIPKIVDETAKLAPEVYADLAKPIAKEVGDTLGRTTKALLSPLRGMLWCWEKIEKILEEGISKRLEAIPEDKRQTPAPEIAVPLIQALSYTAQNETLREMYLNLLANSMNSAKDKDVHPSFVEIIKQMNSLDAKVFDKLQSNILYQQIINPTIKIKGTNTILTHVTPQWFMGRTIVGHDIFEVSASLVRLSKFGLIDLMFDRTAGKDLYDSLASDPELLTILSKCKEKHPEMELEIAKTESVLQINECGKQFKNACT